MCTETTKNPKKVWKMTKRRIAGKISDILEEYIRKNKRKNSKKAKSAITTTNDLSPFNSSKPTGGSVLEFLIKIISDWNIEESTIILSFIYLNRLINEIGLLLTDYNVQK
jgi:hypothetical protein